MFQSSAATLYGVPIKDSQISLSRAAFVLFLLALGLPKRSLASSPQSSSDSDGNSMPSHLWDTMLHVCEIVFYWLLAIIAKTIQTHPLCPNLIGRSGGPSNHIDMVRLCLQFKLNRFVDIWLDGPSDHELRAHPLCPVDHFVVHWTIQSDCNGQLDHPIRLSWGTWTLDLSCFIQIWLDGPVDHGSTCSWSSGPRLDWLVVQWTTAWSIWIWDCWLVVDLTTRLWPAWWLCSASSSSATRDVNANVFSTFHISTRTKRTNPSMEPVFVSIIALLRRRRHDFYL